VNAYTLYTAGGMCTVWLVWTAPDGSRRTAYLLATGRDHGDSIVRAFRRTPASTNFPAVLAAVGARRA
jgi:hypothetical protein